MGMKHNHDYRTLDMKNVKIIRRVSSTGNLTYKKPEQQKEHVVKTVLREILRPLPWLAVLYLTYHIIKAYSQ